MSLIAIQLQAVSEKRSLVRTRTFTGVPAEEILNLMRRESFTGRVVVDMSQGGVCAVQVEDRASVPLDRV